MPVTFDFLNSKIEKIECNGHIITEYRFENGVLSLFNEREVFGENFGKNVINVTFRAVNGILIRADIGAVVFSDSEEVTLSGTQEIFLDRGEASINIGEYDGATVYSIFCNDYYLGNDVAALAISDEFKANKVVHGNSTVTALIKRTSITATTKTGRTWTVFTVSAERSTERVIP